VDGWEKDLPPGEKLVSCPRSFLEYLASSALSPKTIQKHVDNFWGWAERSSVICTKPSLRRKDAAQILRDVIGDDREQLIHGGNSEEAQRSFDSTCRKLYRFLNQSPG
jgi:hypothetical protein